MKNHLCNRNGRIQSTHPTYYEAVREGQRTLGYFNFEIQTPGRVPTYEEQMLKLPPVTTSRRREILESL